MPKCVGIECENVNDKVEARSEKCIERTLNEDHEEILKNKSRYCVQCNYKKKFVSVDYSSHMLQMIPTNNSKRERRHSWNGTLHEYDFSEFNDSCIPNDAREEVRVLMLNLFMKKAHELLVLHTRSFEKIHSFKNEISEKEFLYSDIKRAYSYMYKFVFASANTLNLWLQEVQSTNETLTERFKSNHNSSPQKRTRYNLSLKKSKENCNLDDDDDDMERVNENNEANVEVEPKESINEIEENSDDSIYSQMTEENCSITKEGTTNCQVLENKEPCENEMDDNSRESIKSEASYVFNISSVEERLDDQIELPLVEENASNDVFQMCTQEYSFNSLLGLEYNDDDVDCKEVSQIQDENDMERLLRNIEDEPFSISEEESFGDEFDDEGVDEYIELPEGIYGKITNTLPSLPFVDDCTGVAINENCHNALENCNVKDCSVVLEKLPELTCNNNDNETVHEENNRNVSEDEENEIKRLLDIESLEKKRKYSPPGNSSSKKIKPNTDEPCSNVLDLDSSDNCDEDDDLATLEKEHPAENNVIECNTDAEILESLISKLWDDKEDECQEESETIAKKKRKTFNEDENKQSNKENEPETNDLPASEKKLKTDCNSDWRSDPLLRCILRVNTEKKSDTLNLKDGNIPDDLRDRISKLEARMLNTENSTTGSKEKESKNEEPEPVDLDYISDEEDEQLNHNEIVVNSESDSDIEFVSMVEDATQDDNVNDPETTKGRKNIRPILDYETLTQATKEANLLEKKRKNRLCQKQKNMEAILSQSQFSEDDDAFILDVDETTKTPNIVVHTALTKKLKPHQKAGIKFMWDSCYEGVQQIANNYSGSGCILAHCMGLGKTLQVVTLIHTLFSHKVTNTKYVLVVCPLSVVPHWQREFHEALNNTKDNLFRVFCISNRTTKRSEKLHTVDIWRRETGVLILGYECYHRLISPKTVKSLTTQESNIETLSNPGPDLVVLDEGHLIKNEHSVRSKAFRSLKTKRRIVLTGTPLQNNLMEYYFMIQFVKPNLLGSVHEFKNRFANPITNGQYHDSTEKDIINMKSRSHVLNKLLKGTVQRFELSELVPYLKTRHDYAVFIQLHPLQMNLYEREAHIAESCFQECPSSKQIISNYHKFKCIWGHPYVFRLKEMAAAKLNKGRVDAPCDNFWWNEFCPADSDTNVNYGPKLKVMLNIIKECELVGDKVLIFSNSLLELDAIEHFLQQRSTSDSQWVPNEDYLRMDGRTLSETRVQLCDSFNDKNDHRKRVFLISKIGGMGINLIGANRVILMNVSWNPADDSQSVFRIYRFGQEKECFIYRLVSMGTMEEVVYDRQVTKLATSGRVIDSLQITRHFKSNDLQIFFRPKFNRDQVRPTPPLPADCVLAKVLQSCNEIFRYHEHQSLLENLPHENLNEQQMKSAWEEFNKENERENELLLKRKVPLNIPPCQSTADSTRTTAIPYLKPRASFEFVSTSDTFSSTTLTNKPEANIMSDQNNRKHKIIKAKILNNPVLNKTSLKESTEENNVIDLANNNVELNNTELIVKQNVESHKVYVNSNRNNKKLGPSNFKKKKTHKMINPVVLNNKNHHPKSINDNIPIINLDPIVENSSRGLSNKIIEPSSSNSINFAQPKVPTTKATGPIINLDEINDDNLLKKEQQSLIWELNKNLDITLSAIEKNAHQIVSQNKQIGEIIEID